MVAQTSAITTRDAIERARSAVDMGADAVMVLPPYFEGPFERGVLFHYEKLAHAIDVPIVLYNIPINSGFDIHPALYRKLIAIDNIEYIKDSTGDLIRLQQLIGIGGNVLAGADPLAPYAAMAGAAGWIWGAANVMPHECVSLWNLIQDGDVAAALDLWSRMLPANLFFWDNDVDAEYNSAVKTATTLVGRPVGPCRRPVMPMTRQGRVALQSALSPLSNRHSPNLSEVGRAFEDLQYAVPPQRDHPVVYCGLVNLIWRPTQSDSPHDLVAVRQQPVRLLHPVLQGSGCLGGRRQR